MMWEYAEFPDGTAIAYSETREDMTVRIAVERPRDGGFDTAHCLMPAYRWSDVDGFSDHELTELEEFLRNNAPLIFELAENPEDRWPNTKKGVA